MDQCGSISPRVIYRYHWATTSARIKKLKAPAKLDGGVVMERHYALNWLIKYMDQDWDNISTDTQDLIDMNEKMISLQ